MNRRKFLGLLPIGGLLGFAVFKSNTLTASNQSAEKNVNTTAGEIMPNSIDELAALERNPATVTPFRLSKKDWQSALTEEQFYILRKEGTERAFTSPLNDEKREGEFVCAGCGLALFKSDMKYDSGTGWPSFFTSIEGRLASKIDFKIGYPRREYHCARCGGHHGHVFKDGPQPTGLRYCNNGVALKFIPA
jgi:peptide-methionine (R)-S-oxide reductase